VTSQPSLIRHDFSRPVQGSESIFHVPNADQLDLRVPPATPLFGADDLQRNGPVPRHIWTPNFATGETVGLRVSAGLALGLRDSIRSNLGRSVASALTIGLGRASSVSLLPAASHGAILVLQTMP
jgi:hypothetical protein